MSAKKALGASLCKVIALSKTEGEKYSKSNGGASFYSVFSKKVPLSSVPDYEKFVPENRAMWLEKIRDKAKRGAYCSSEEFMADIRQIVENAQKYNGPEGGKVKAEWLPNFATMMYGYFEDLLQRFAREIKAGEDRILAAATARLHLKI